MEHLKYQYHLLTWGGFYNDEYKKIHNLSPGDYLFDTVEEREDYIEKLNKIEAELNAKHLAITTTEGYNCDKRTILHRVTRFENKDYHTQYDMGINYPYDAASYHMEYKWYPGFNDYPLGETFNYRRKDWKVVQEWIEGSFDQNTED